MIITCITHADARDKKQYPFRGLTKQGWQEVEQSAKQFRALIDDQTPKIEAVISSPKARCVETAVLFAKAISDWMTTSEIQLEPDLKAGSVAGRELFDLANRAKGQHLLVSAHADLVQALPEHTKLKREAADDGWFTTRPVLIQLTYDRGESWNSAQLVACEGLADGVWHNMLEM